MIIISNDSCHTRITLFAIQIYVSKHQKCLIVDANIDMDEWINEISVRFFFFLVFLMAGHIKDDRFERMRKNNAVNFWLYVESSKPHTFTLCKHNDKHFPEAKRNIYIPNFETIDCIAFNLEQWHPISNTKRIKMMINVNYTAHMGLTLLLWLSALLMMLWVANSSDWFRISERTFKCSSTFECMKMSILHSKLTVAVYLSTNGRTTVLAEYWLQARLCTSNTALKQCMRNI